MEGEDWSYATSFPMPVNIGAAFDDEGVQEMGRRVSLEARGWNNAGRGGLDFWVSSYPLSFSLDFHVFSFS